ncbi:MAG: SusC/RagA family TonB-linked outer membrane protein, partial [Bacteroidales bacterium]
MNQSNDVHEKSYHSDFYKLLTSVAIAGSLSSFMPATAFASPEIKTTAEMQQNKVVTGKIKDATGEGIISASVSVKGTTIGTVTDLDGNFKLQTPGKGTLVISYIGYKTVEVPISDKPVNITLQEDTELLDEVVVVGYGTVKRANMTGAVSSVDMRKLDNIPASNLSSVLMGSMPGVNVSEVTGNPLANASIKVRINGSWNAEPPLYVIDGFIRDEAAFNLLDPSEIENISVLKDAQASVYGVRGAGGVILVTTRKGKEGKIKFNYSGSYGFSQGVKMPEMMSAYEQGRMLNDLFDMQAEEDISKLDLKFSETALTKMRGMNHNWLEQGWKNSNNTRHTLNVSGGTEKVRYFVGGSYMWADGNFANMDVNRFNVRSGLDINFTKDILGSFNLSYSQKDTEMPLNQKDAEADRMYGTFSDLVRTPRWIPAYINGLPTANGVDQSSGTHPLAIFDSGSFRRNKDQQTAMGARFDWNIPYIKGMKVSLQGNYSRSSSYGKALSKSYNLYEFEKEETYLLLDTPTGNTRKIVNGDKLEESANFSYSYQLNPSISYNNTFGKHDISAIAVYEQSESGGNRLGGFRNGMIIDKVETTTGFGTDGQTFTSSINTLGRRQSFIGRVNYNYGSKNFIESTARYESSANFAPKYRWGLFPSVAASWRISEEDFFRDAVPFMDNLKLRANYGRLGNDKVTMAQWQESYGAGSNIIFGSDKIHTSLQPTLEGLMILDATWETTDSYNVGIESTWFKFLTVNIDAFYKHTFDILDDSKSEFPQSAGIAGASPKRNYGIQDAWGGELEIGYQQTLTKDWTINAKGSLAYATSKVKRKYQTASIVGTWKDEIGKIRGGETGYQCMGIARTQADVDNYIAYLRQNLTNPNEKATVFGVTEDKFKPGMLMYKDVGSAIYKDANGVWKDGAPDGKISSDGDERII